jgi:hypothetical protein
MDRGLYGSGVLVTGEARASAWWLPARLPLRSRRPV